MGQKLRRGFSVALAAGSCCLSPLTAMSADLKDTLPKANTGECYAKVSVPAVYKAETVDIVLKEASNTFTIAPVRFIDTTTKVMVRESSTSLTPVQPVYDIVDEDVVLSPASRSWVRGSLDSDVPASKGMLLDLSGSGVDVDSVPVGQCYYEHYKPGATRTVKEQVLIADATEELDVVPATFAASQKQLMVKAASRILVAEPAVYETVAEDIVIEPAHAVWEKGRGLIERIDNTTGEIMCRVNVPARYETISKQVIKTPAVISTQMVPAEFDSVTVETVLKDATETRTPVPAQYETVERTLESPPGKTKWLKIKNGNKTQYGQPTGLALCYREVPANIKTIKRKVVRAPGRFDVAEVPAAYASIRIQKLGTRASEVKVPVAAKTDTLIRRIMVSDTRLEWRPVLCETNITADIVKRIQTALNGKGYSAGVADGLLGRGTFRALEKFQEDQNLAQGGLTYTTIKALGVKL